MKQIVRNFLHVLRKYKTTSIMVILGLTTAFTVFLIVLVQYHHDYSYNSNFNGL
jgi:putative ABC transport system permease protein